MGYTVKVTGLNAHVRALKQIGVGAADLREAFGTVAKTGQAAAQGLSPKRTGRMAGGIRASRRQNAAIIWTTTPYALYHHVGAVTVPSPSQFMWRAQEAVAPVLGSLIEAELNRIIKAAGY